MLPSPRATPVPDSPDTDLHPAKKRKTTRLVFDCVLLPRIPERCMPEIAKGLPPVDEIVGYCVDPQSNRAYYYARFKKGIAYRFPREDFLRSHSDLFPEYNRRRKTGELADFDPSSQAVHPMHRLHVDTAGVPAPDHEDEDLYDDEGESEVDNDDDDGDFNDDEDTPALARRSSRNAGTKANASGNRNTRSRGNIINLVNDDSDNEPLQSRAVGSRRSTRTRKQNPDFVESDLSEEGSDYEVVASTKFKPKQARRPRAALPAYGFIRSVEDIDLDPLGDDSTAYLRTHRRTCEKCQLQPAHELLQALRKRKKKGKGRKRARDEDLEDSDDEEERYMKLGGWVRCLKCPVAAHYKCLAGHQRDEILKAARAKQLADWQRGGEDGSGPAKKSELTTSETTDFLCGSCVKGSRCMYCHDVCVEPNSHQPAQPSPPATTQDGDVVMADGTASASTALEVPATPASQLFFRCATCKRAAHYEHMLDPPDEDDASAINKAEYYQSVNGWLCGECSSFIHPLDKILAWRPDPPNTVEPARPRGIPVNHKENLPRAYLVKWEDRSYRRVQWVPHMWLLSTSQAKLKNFLAEGPKVDLLNAPTPSEDKMDVDDENSIFGTSTEPSSRAQSIKPSGFGKSKIVDSATLDAEDRIPITWKTVDRVLDVRLWNPRKLKQKKKVKAAKNFRRKEQRIESDESESEVDEDAQVAYDLAFEDGVEPEQQYLETIDEFLTRSGEEKFDIMQIDLVIWAYMKYEDLGYDEATWDSPPRSGESGYNAFKRAFSRYIDSLDVHVKKMDPARARAFDNRPADEYIRKFMLKDAADLDLGQGPDRKLMPFQVDGFNWLCNNWWTRQPCILADEMGLGKTVQVASFVGKIATTWNAYPVLVVVPNSTITNWVREFERWVPQLRVVPFYGEAKARDIIKRYELFHQGALHGTTGAKFHVLIATYESVTGVKDFGSIFKKQPRWECLIVDEGQRLKSDKSLLFTKLTELNSRHRIIMTGTPLNNNIRELFNLMNFLDPDKWNDLPGLEREYEVLTEELVKQLHERLRPYFLRRIKSEVLTLPPKNEVIVPVTMTPLQREVSRSILSKNVDILNSLINPQSRTNGNVVRRNVKNMLMQLRKNLQHPYLYSEDIEPKDLSAVEMHEKLIDGSTKLRLLKMLLPKLKARGHRVLIFSQFVIALNILEDFLIGEGYRYLRLDGSTGSKDREKRIDEFNQPDSDVFIFLLTTRAGGVGINLYTADTVIIFDPDFNPHQDLQAIARIHRFGQTKACLVFKLMVKDSAEERIMQVGKKKMVLDHVIVQKMDDDGEAGEDVQSILTYGAQALFEDNQESRDVNYSEQDVLNLIEKTEKEGDQEENVKEGALSFSFAKVWSTDKAGLEEINENDQMDSWAATLQKINEERNKIQKEQETTQNGRPSRRVAALNKKNYVEETPLKEKKAKGKGKQKATAVESDGSAYAGSESETESAADNASASAAASEANAHTTSHKRKVQGTPQPQQHVRQTGPSTSSQSQSRQPFYRPPYAPNYSRSHPPVPSQPVVGASNLTRYRDPSQYNENDDSFRCVLCNKIHGSGACQIASQNPQKLIEYREMLMFSETEPFEVRVEAIERIDEILAHAGLAQAIVGQPLHVVRLDQPPNPGSRHPESSIAIPTVPLLGLAMGPVEGPSMMSVTRSSNESYMGPVVGPSAGPSGAPDVTDRDMTDRLAQMHVNHMESGDLIGNAKSAPSTSKAATKMNASQSMSVRVKRPALSSSNSSKKARALMSYPQAPHVTRCMVCGEPFHLLEECPAVKEGPERILKEIKRLEKDPANALTVSILKKKIVKRAAAPESEVLEISD